VLSVAVVPVAVLSVAVLSVAVAALVLSVAVASAAVVVSVLVASVLTFVSGVTVSASVVVWAIAVPASSSAIVKAAAFIIFTPLQVASSGPQRHVSVAAAPGAVPETGRGRTFSAGSGRSAAKPDQPWLACVVAAAYRLPLSD
jgi:hypothetical protein